MPIIESGLRPVPVDIDSATLNVSSQTLGKILSKYNLKALILTNLLGFCSDIDNISNLCRQQKVILLEDNCEALGSVYGRKKLGNFGLASTFSFYVGHHLSAIEGGAIVTDDAQLATMLRVVRAHGWDRELSDTAKRDIRKHYGVKSGFDAQYTFYDLGYNMRPTEITGFLGNVQLKSIEVILRKRRENFAYLAERIYGRTDLYNPVRTDHIDSVPAFAFPVICRNIKIRDLLTGRCRGKVEIRPIMGGNIADQPFFRKYVKEFQYDCPNAEWARNHGLYFGINPEMTRNELDRIISVFTGI
jgi:CDP-6-deoxy-D-xylo-4-hexulose-3-dehydrase